MNDSVVWCYRDKFLNNRRLRSCQAESSTNNPLNISPVSHALKVPIDNRITSYNVCYTKLLRNSASDVVQKSIDAYSVKKLDGFEDIEILQCEVPEGIDAEDDSVITRYRFYERRKRNNFV